MRTYGSDVRQARTLTQIYQDALTIVFQDVGEYAFIGLVGCCLAGLLVMVLHVAGGMLSLALVAPTVMLLAVVTIATSMEAFRRVVDNLEPDAARSFWGAAPHLGALLRPLAPIVVLLVATSLAGALLDGRGGEMVRQSIALAVTGFSAFYILPRSLACPVLLTQRASGHEAEAASAALVWRAPMKVAATWVLTLALPLLAFVVALDAGFGSLSSAIAAVLLVLSMPLAGVAMMLLYYDALAGMARSERPAKQREAPDPVARRAATVTRRRA